MSGAEITGEARQAALRLAIYQMIGAEPLRIRAGALLDQLNAAPVREYFDRRLSMSQVASALDGMRVDGMIDCTVDDGGQVLIKRSGAPAPESWRSPSMRADPVPAPPAKLDIEPVPADGITLTEPAVENIELGNEPAPPAAPCATATLVQLRDIRCALWSDGRLTIAAADNGGDCVTFSPRATRTLIDYLDRRLAPADPLHLTGAHA